MTKVKYTSQFKEALDLCTQNGLFLGLGNPNATFLIIGKEAAIDKESDSWHYEMEVANNVTDWGHNFEKNKQFEEVLSWFEETTEQKYNPLFPYKGQKNTIESRNKKGEIIRGGGGTSKTWYNYQKIADLLFHNNIKSNTINFQEHIFISELNQESAEYSHLVPKATREESITKRKPLFDTTFFKDFPITIVAVGHYVRDFDIDLQKIFGVTYAAEISKQHSEGLKNEYINVHYDNFENPTRLLIHTNQLSMVSNELVQRLGEICKTFLLASRACLREPQAPGRLESYRDRPSRASATALREPQGPG